MVFERRSKSVQQAQLTVKVGPADLIVDQGNHAASVAGTFAQEGQAGNLGQGEDTILVEVHKAWDSLVEEIPEVHHKVRSVDLAAAGSRCREKGSVEKFWYSGYDHVVAERNVVVVVVARAGPEVGIVPGVGKWLKVHLLAERSVLRC